MRGIARKVFQRCSLALCYSALGERNLSAKGVRHDYCAMNGGYMGLVLIFIPVHQKQSTEAAVKSPRD